MFVDSVTKLLLYFTKSTESTKTTMSTAIVSNSELQSLYEIVENGLKDNVSMIHNCCMKFEINIVCTMQLTSYLILFYNLIDTK